MNLYTSSSGLCEHYNIRIGDKMDRQPVKIAICDWKIICIGWQNSCSQKYENTFLGSLKQYYYQLCRWYSFCKLFTQCICSQKWLDCQICILNMANFFQSVKPHSTLTVLKFCEGFPKKRTFPPSFLFTPCLQSPVAHGGEEAQYFNLPRSWIIPHLVTQCLVMICLQ